MQCKLLGLAPVADIGGANGPEHYQAAPGQALVVFEFQQWDESHGQAAIRAMESAANALTGGAITVTQAAHVVTALDPKLSHPALLPAAQAADQILAASKAPGGLTVKAAIPIALHLAASSGILGNGNAQTVATILDELTADKLFDSLLK